MRQEWVLSPFGIMLYTIGRIQLPREPSRKTEGREGNGTVGLYRKSPRRKVVESSQNWRYGRKVYELVIAGVGIKCCVV